MGLLDMFRPAVSQATAAARVEPPVLTASETVSSESQWKGTSGFRVGGAPSKAGVRVNENSALSLPATLQALRILSGVFAMTPLHYYRRSEKGRINANDQGVGRLVTTAPNAHQTQFAFFELLMADLLLTGNFYAYKSRNARGEVVAMTRLKPGTVLVSEFFDKAEGTFLFYDATLPDGSRERFPARDILHVAGMSRDGVQGLNPITFARDALGGAIATGDHASNFWSKGGRPGTVLKSKQKIAPESKAQIKGDWQSLYSGPNGDAVAVLDQELDVSFLSHDMRASQFVETRGFQVLDLARIWGVPPHLIFDLSKATFGNIEQQSLEFVIYHLGPHYARVAQAVTKSLADEGFYFEHLTDALVRGDLKSRMDAYWLQRQMGMVNANELRKRENLPDLDGDAGTEVWRPSNMAVAGEPDQTKTGDIES